RLQHRLCCTPHLALRTSHQPFPNLTRLIIVMRPRVSAAAVVAACLYFAPVTAFAQASGEPLVPEKVGKDLHAYRISGQPPRIDGRLDDEVWTLAQSVDDFVQNEPDNMAPPRDRTAMQVAYDDRALYVA